MIGLTDIDRDDTKAAEERRHHEIKFPAIGRLIFESGKEKKGDEDEFEYGEDDRHVDTFSYSTLGEE